MVDSLDLIAATQGALSSPAARRNAAAILQVLRAHLAAAGAVLEVASGTGEHAVAFAGGLPGVTWTPSDPSDESRASIASWRAASGLPNLVEPLALDVLDDATWPSGPFKAILCANMIHISRLAATEGLMRLAARVLTDPGGLLVLYGPFLEAEVETAPSNLAFDQSLKSRNTAWGLRDRDAVVALAREHGLAYTFRYAMPANNLILLFRRA